MVSNRMARFTHPEGFPDAEALFEVQIKAVQGETVSIDAGTIDYGYWSGAPAPLLSACRLKL